MPAFLNGLAESGAVAEYQELLTHRVEEGNHLVAVARHLRGLGVRACASSPKGILSASIK